MSQCNQLRGIIYIYMYITGVCAIVFLHNEPRSEYVSRLANIEFIECWSC